MRSKIVVIGGCGHVGLPLGVAFSLAGYDTLLMDSDRRAVGSVNEGHFPFLERGGDEKLQAALQQGLRASSDPQDCGDRDVFVFVVGTPVDEHLNPKLSDVIGTIDAYEPYVRSDSLVVMRSTLFPGTMEHIRSRLQQSGKRAKLAFCPERVSQGYALEEIETLPQVVSAFDDASFDSAYELFRDIAPSVIRLTPIEAEMTKLMANSWRYLEFAIANQFYMIAESSGVDFYRVYDAIRYDYPRAQGYKSPGFAAGPCLFKDTMQLASFFDNKFYLGHSAMLVNEGLASFAVEKLRKLFDNSLWGKKVAILGLAFKANNDDIRESLSFKVKKGLEFYGAEVLCHDPYRENERDLNEVLRMADGAILCTPHREYQALNINKPLVDVWGNYRTTNIEILPGFERNS
ncbi:MAG: nucleotide sugar dehydrogenase [Bdellovibrionales bacterium]|nr:nucleotide sugar dehydrogenase [Bdellovibrionales bacterium]